MFWLKSLLILVSISNSLGNHHGSEDITVSLIELEALALPVQSYIHDPFWFYQKIDPKTQGTTYHASNGSKLGSAIFRRNSNDEGEDVVVLKAGEDRLRLARVKQTFVVLIKDKLNHQIYRPIFAYARYTGKFIRRCDYMLKQKLQSAVYNLIPLILSLIFRIHK